jgi:GT2 family glycosyltransferase
MKSPHVSFIVVSYNRRENTVSCLNSIYSLDYPSFDIIVVDGSTDGTTEEVKKRFPQTKIIQNKENLGVVKAHNIGLEETSGDYVIRVDDDVTLEKNFLKELVNVMESDPTVGIAGPKIYYLRHHGLLWCVGGKIEWWRGKDVTLGDGEKDVGQYNTRREVDYIGCCMLVRREVVEKIGKLDECYFLYFEDLDYNVRARKAGYRIIYVPSAVAYHDIPLKDGSRSVSNSRDASRFYYHTRNKFIFFKKYATNLQFASIILHFTFFELPGLGVRYILYFRDIKTLKAGLNIIKDLPSVILRKKNVV